MDPQNLFIITGGPGAGKTTVLTELQRLGFTCVPEVARQIIQELGQDVLAPMIQHAENGASCSACAVMGALAREKASG